MVTRKHDRKARATPGQFARTGTRGGAAAEVLEGRRMLAAHPLATAALDASGALVVTGTGKADVIRVELNRDDATRLDVTCNGTTTTFDLSAITGGLHVLGRNGNDDVRVDAGVSLHAELRGGNGNDLLAGGSGDDLLNGGNGKDDLEGNGGADDLRGGNGKDRLLGGDGDDRLHGDNASDDLDGEAGADHLSGGRGMDHCLGGAGDDFFDGHDRDEEQADMESGDCEVLTLKQLPPEVRAKFGALYDGVTVSEIEGELEDGSLHYKFEFVTAEGASGEVVLDASGNVLA